MDHVRVAMTALVILHHVAISYGGAGGWYWREQPNGSQPLLILFNAFNQSYFMGFFFLLAGYYTPASVERKGAGRYLVDRLVRLGLPLVVYFFFLSTLTIALDRTTQGHAFWAGWRQMIAERRFGPGPLWFAEALLLLAVGYLAWRRWWPGRGPVGVVGRWPSFARVLGIALGLGAANVVVRLWIPVGQEVLWLQLGYFPCYVALFIAGCAASRGAWLETLTWPQVRPWLRVMAVAGVALLVVFLLRGQRGGFDGGWSFNAVFYAFWDPLMAPGAILGWLWWAHTRWSRSTPLSATLARGAFAAFIVHPPVAVGCGLMAAGWALPPLVKFALVGTLAVAGSFGLGAALRLIPGSAKIL